MEKGLRKIIIAAACLALFGGLVASSSATTWDLVTDFDSITTNPSPDGIWSIGYPLENVVSPYLLYTYTSNYGYLPNAYGWIYEPQAWMGLVKSAQAAGDLDCPPGRVGGHAIWGLQWTAPRATTISIVGGMWLMRELGRQVGVHLAINGLTIINGTYGEPNRAVIPTRAEGYTSAHPYSLAEAIESTGGQVSSLCNIAVSQGDTVMLATGSGSADFTGCDFTIYESTDTPGTITGIITDASSGLPIENALVEILGTSASDTTGADGVYTLSNVIPGYSKLRVTASQHLTKTAIVTVAPGQTVTEDIALTFGGEVWDLAADFSQSSNPGSDGTWAYGAVNYPDCNAFSELFTNHVNSYSTGELGGSSPGWMSAIDWWVGVCKGGGGASVDLPAGRVGGHAPWGVRWTAPKDCTVDISGGCWMMRESPDRRNGVTISIKGAKLMDNAQIPLPSEGVTSANPFTYAQAIISKGGDPNTLNGIAVNRGDTVWLVFHYISAYDYVGADFTIRESGTQGDIGGIVRDASNNQPIANAVVQLDETAYSATTAADGSYTLSDAPAGGYTATFLKAGYVTESMPVTVVAGTTVTADAWLDPGRDVWDLAADFSDASNPSPSGVWAYGSLAADANGLAPLFTKHVNSYLEHGTAHGWVRPDQDWIGLVKSAGAGPHDLPAGRIGGHAPTGCRWTAPKDCAINIVGGVWNEREMLPPRTLGVTLSVNGTIIIDNVSVPQPNEGFTSSYPFSLAQAVLAGGGQVGSLSNVSVRRGDNVYLGVQGITNTDFMGIDFTITEAVGTPTGDYGIGAAKKAGPGWYCTVPGIVTAVLTDSNMLALEDENRSAAIMVTPIPATVPELGDELRVLGYIDWDGVLHSITAEPTGRTDVVVNPLGMSNKSITGAVGNPGLDNMAMLVTSWMKVIGAPKTLTNGWQAFHITDGTAIPGGPTVVVSAQAPGTEIIFQDDFSGDKSNWRDDAAPTSIESGRLAAQEGARTVVTVADYLNTKVSVETFSLDGTTLEPFGVMLRYTDASNFVLAYYTPQVPVRMGIHDVRNGDYGPTNWVAADGLNPNATITLTAEVHNDTCRAAITDGSLSYYAEMPLTHNLGRGLVGVWNDVPTVYDNFRVYETLSELQVPADAVQVLIPPSVFGVDLPADGNYVSVTGIAGKGYTMNGNLRSITIRQPSDIVGR
ncbi:MAG: carboxypeptidase regulatory-like domain-containing protein [Armatimonadetes bacterium]|nr:carboxypeptidase regulatory-like domain-containing protein [Armatimonadota bacterium]